MIRLSAITAIWFASIAIIGGLVLGSPETQQIMLWAALVAALAQFLALDDRIRVLQLSVIVSYVAMGLIAWGLFVL